MISGVSPDKPKPKRVKKVNARLAALLKAALIEGDLTIDELGERSKLGRQATGRIVRGEIQRLAPEQANRIAPHLPITMAQILEACGYNMSATQPQRVAPQLVEAVLKLGPEDRRSILRSARALAAYPPEEPEPNA